MNDFWLVVYKKQIFEKLVKNTHYYTLILMNLVRFPPSNIHTQFEANLCSS